MAKRSKRKTAILDRTRPHCPKCGMRMIATAPEKFECMRCGHTGRRPEEVAQ